MYNETPICRTLMSQKNRLSHSKKILQTPKSNFDNGSFYLFTYLCYLNIYVEFSCDKFVMFTLH